MKKIKEIISKFLTFVMVITNVLLCFTNTAYASTVRLNYNTEKSENDLDLDVSFNDTTVVDNTKINVKADKGVFPANSYMEAVATSSELVKTSDNEDSDDKVAAKKAFDITIYDEDGNEIEPDISKGQVTVTFSDDLIEDQNVESTFYHINEDNEVEELPIIDNDRNSVTVETDGFSVYVVEFKYNKKNFILNGDTATRLDDILTAVGLSGVVSNAVSSNEELFTVELVEGEYIVQAKQAFNTEETLTVTLNDLDYIINVTNKENSVIINNLEAVLRSGAKKQDDKYIWNTQYSISGHTFVYRLNFSTSGEFEIKVPEFTYDDKGNVTSAEGGFQLRVPKNILKDKDGNFADSYEMSVPLLSKNNTSENTNKYAYFVDGDELVIVNIQELPAATAGMFDIAYTTTMPTYNYMDMGISDDFFGKLTVSDQYKESNKIPVYINTSAEILSTYKNSPKLCLKWEDSWGTKPDDADDYYYLIWEIETNIKKPVTQKYDFELTDTLITTDHTELVGYKLQGESQYSSQNKVTNCTPKLTSPNSDYSYNTRYDYVLTRHEKTYYNTKTYYEIKNKIVATVTPADGIDPETKASSTKTFSFNKPVFKKPAGYIGLHKYGNENWHNFFNYEWPYAAYNLQTLQKESTQGQKSINNIKYFAIMEAYTYPWTLNEGADTLNPENYGKNPVNIEFKDDMVYLLNPEDQKFVNIDYYKNTKDITETAPLNPEDYDFSYATYDVIMEDVKFDDFYQKFTTINGSHHYNENDILTFSVKSNNEWHENIASIDLYTNETTIDNVFITELTNDKIVFGKDVDGYKINFATNHYRVRVSMYPYINLYNTANIQSIIGTGDQALEWVSLKNVDSLKATKASGDLICDEARIIGDRLRKAEKNSHINKRITSSKNDTAHERYLLGWAVYANETIKQGNNDSSEYIPQESGTFYDLIPEGATIQRSSVTVYNNGSKLSSNFYDVDIIKDWRNSGRDMLIVKIKTQGTRFNVYYTTIHPWTSIMDRGSDVYNPVAFETGNEEISKGYRDDGGKLPDSQKAYFTNLDPEYDAVLNNLADDVEGRFIYDDAYGDINALLSATTGLDKKVRTSDTENWSYNAFVHNEDTYEYQLRYANSDNTSTKGLVLYDSLENYYLTEGAKQSKSDWQGKFLRVDVSQLEDMGIAPVVYYSTEKNLDLDEQPDLSDTKWTTVLPDDTSTVKAIAIDVHKGINGEDFILKNGEAISATVFMQVPEGITFNYKNYPRTFNNVYASGTVVDKNSNESDFYIHQDYTVVNFRKTGNIYLRKVNEQETDKGIPNIDFTLTGTSYYGNEINETRLSDANGYISFKDIDAGTYSLQETYNGSEWIADHNIHKVIINENGETYIDDILNNDNTNICVLKNTPRIHNDITFWKEKYGTHIGLSGAEFKLSGISDYGNDIIQYQKSVGGKVTFEDIEKGTYTLTELKATDGYYIQNKELGTFIINEYGLVSFEPNNNTDNEEDAAGSIIIYNIPYYDFQISKRSDYDNGAIAGAKFKLTGTSDYGTVVNKTITTGSTGLAKFTKLEVGKYILQEIEVPEDFILDDTKRIVTVPKDGNIIIEGLSKNEFGNFSIINRQKNDKEIRIYKKWVDNDDSKRTLPSFTLSAIKPKQEMEPAYLKRNFAYQNSKYIPMTSFIPYTGEDYSTLTIKEVENKPNSYRIDSQQTNSRIYMWTETEESQDYVYWTNAEKMYFPYDSSYMFQNNTTIKKIDLTAFDTSKVEQMAQMFSGCNNLIELNVSNWNTKNVFNMYEMFCNCSSLAKLDVSKWNVQNVGTMYEMFLNCQSLAELDLSGWNPPYYVNNSAMFVQCKLKTLIAPKLVKQIHGGYYGPSDHYDPQYYYWSNPIDELQLDLSLLEELDASDWTTKGDKLIEIILKKGKNLKKLKASNWDTSKVTDMSKMFSNSKLEELDISNWDTSDVTNMSEMFKGCVSLTTLHISNWDTHNVTNMAEMFNYCYNLKILDLSRYWDTHNVTDMNSMFDMCEKLTSINVSNWDTSKVTNMHRMFTGCYKLTDLNVSGWNTSNVTDMNQLFGLCDIVEIDVSNWDVSKVTDMTAIFGMCDKLKTIKGIENWNPCSATTMDSLFYGCTSLTKLDLSNWDVSNVTNMDYMFSAEFNTANHLSMKLTTVGDLSNWNTSKVTSMKYMFVECSSLTELNLSNWDISNVTKLGCLFSDCKSLKTINLSNWNLKNVTMINLMFDGCTSLKTIKGISNWNTSNIETLDWVFQNCSSLTSIDLSGWDTSNVTSTYDMFYNCSSLTSIDLSGWDTSSIENTRYMFNGCSSLTTIYVSDKWNVNIAENSEDMFKGCEKLPNFDSSIVDKTNAHYGEDGYLTYKVSSNPGMIVLNNNIIDKLLNLFTITAYADEQMQVYHSVTSNAFYIPNVDEKTPLEKFGTYNEITKQYEWTAENNGYWSKVDDDLWVYTFHVYDTNLDWYVYEGDTKGYIGLNTNYSSDHLIDNPGLIKADDAKEFIITNSIKNPDPEPEIVTKSLTVKKQVVNKDHQNIDDSTEFTFHVEFDIPDFNDDIAIFGDTVFNKDNDIYKADISLKSTEEITFTDIPINTVYTVTEEEVNNYISETPVKTGTLTDDESLSFINILDIPDTVKHNISISKTVIGRSNDNSFEMHVFIENCLDGEYSLSNGDSIIVKNQTGYATVNLHADETVIINQLPTGTIVTVTETGGKNYKAEGYIDENGIKTAGNSAIAGKDLTLSYTIPEEIEEAGFIINNTIIQTQDLTIKKKVIDSDGYDIIDENTYTFTVSLQGLPDEAVISTSIGNLIADGSGNIKRDVYLKNGEELQIYELPIDTQYQITEKANKMIGSYEITDNNSQNKIIKISDHNEVVEKDISTELETVDPDEDIIITFTNKEQKVDYLPGTGGSGYSYHNILYLLALGTISNWYYRKKKKLS